MYGASGLGEASQIQSFWIVRAFNAARLVMYRAPTSNVATLIPMRWYVTPIAG